MKSVYLVVMLLIVNQAMAQDSLAVNSLLSKRIPAWVKPVIEKSDVAKNYTIIDSINPFYLEVDLTGDKLDDIVFFVRNNQDGKKGVMIINRGKNILFVLGGGKDIGMGDNVNWCNRWFVYRDKGIFDGVGKKKASLKYPAIRLEKSDRLSLYIYWSGKKYKTYVQLFEE